MKTPLLSIFLVSFLLISLILLSSFLADRNSNYTSIEYSDFVHLEEKSGANQNLNFFEKVETENDYKLTYGWKDYESHPHHITFSISKQQLFDAEEEFGYYPEVLKKYVEKSLEKMRDEMMSHLEKFTSQQVLKSKYSRYILMDEVSPKNFKLKLSAPPSLYDEAKAEFERIKEEISREQIAYFKKMEKEKKKKREAYLKKRGFRFTGDKIGVNYRFCVQNNRDRVRQVVEVMKEKNKKLSLHRFLALMLAFIQEIRYGIPPLSEKNKMILEFWVPPKVLVNNFGDCDSKGVTFASLWTNFKRYPLLLIKIPKHLFVGLAIPSIGGEGLSVNGINYTLCEVTGPDKAPPGLISRYSQLYLEGGKFRYELIR